jgi:recombinational DNA repair protein (RecF pathway)
MYAIHTTRGFIIGSFQKGEADKLIYIFTRDFGLIIASEQSIRLERSKLRYSTQDYTLGTFSFVQGREFYRLTSAISHIPLKLTAPDLQDTAFSSISDSPNSSKGSFLKASLIVRIASLLKRFLNGEQSHPDLFDCVEKGITFISGDNAKLIELSSSRLKCFESLFVARILNRLGYIGNDADLNGYLDNDEFSLEILDLLKDKRVLLNRHINKALKESQL